ncbi:uncharacterized protein LOC119377611 isoform X2 [Rhipicephalus sanguineus]|uniref:uncharacterized protein LOC119377611 isoform X2 n=1 Tax=Rhipicephalus sanguineus TaxID=34632 RepID=UPI0018959655|nr:uncharacterized protein LOC119377611 isoform X2 [Rhipicephalus sanguineus]
MFALVRFVEEKTDKRYVIPVADVANFEPQNELDFDNTMPYDAYWHDEDDDVNSGMYVVQILKLAATREEMDRETKNKRVHIPPIRYSDVDDLPVPEGDIATKKKAIRQEKAKQQNQATARKQQYESVLRQHMKNALGKNRDVAEVVRDAKATAPTLRTSTNSSRGSQSRRNNEESSDSSTDESLVSSKDLKAARKDAKYWRMQCRREREHNASLEKRIEFLEKHIEKRLDSGKNLFFCQLYMLSDNTHAFLVLQILQKQKPCEGHNGVSQQTPTAVVVPQAQKKDYQAATGCMSQKQIKAPLTPATAQPLQVTTSVNDGESTARAVLEEDPISNEQPQVGDFMATPDGRFHLSSGIFITAIAKQTNCLRIRSQLFS